MKKMQLGVMIVLVALAIPARAQNNPGKTTPAEAPKMPFDRSKLCNRCAGCA